LTKVNCPPMHPGLVADYVNCPPMRPERKLELKKLPGLKRKAKLSMILLVFLVLFTEMSPPGIPLFPCSPAGGAMAAEIPAVVYTGDTAAAAVLGNLGYTDLKGGNIWSGEAIFETGALGIVKGFSSASNQFGRTASITKEEALAIAYRAAGREAEARQAGITLNNARAAVNKKTDPLSVLYDGFLQLAANEGLITAQNLADAVNADQTALTAESFRRTAPAQRQEIAYWLAKTLNIQPVGQQQETLNYTDWRSTDPDKLPYMEAILQQGIMTGSGSRINPKQSITREQAAQVVKNSETPVLTALKYVKNSGTIEEISPTKDYTGNIAVTGKNITVRSMDGKTVSIQTTIPASTTTGAKNENAGTVLTSQKKELTVYKNGAIGDSRLLKKGDRLQFITDSSNVVKYVNVVSNVNEVRYLAAQVNSIDRPNLLMNITQLFTLDYPDVKSITGNISFTGAQNEKTSYRVAAGADISVNGAKAALAGVTEDATAILTIDSNNIIKAIQCVDFGINSESRNIVRGIVEENNPNLGYITLYNEDGSGVGSSKAAALRTYNYVDLNNTAIFRNHKNIKADNIQTGDTAYIKLDNEGDISSISAVENYTVSYGRIISKLPSEIAVKYDDGTEQLLETGKNVIVVRDKLLVGLKTLKDGDRVRLLLNDNGKSTDLKEITIEGDEHYISNIYKGTVTKIDDMSDKVTVMGLQVFNKGLWERTDTKGVTVIPLADNFNIYSGDTELDVENVNRLLRSNDAYIAVEKSYGGEEKAILLSYRDSSDTIVPTYSDSITGAVSGSGGFVLSRENQKVSYFNGSIVVKYGRMVSGNSLADNDAAWLALDRDYSTGNYKAAVVKVDEPKTASGLTVYRGRINAISDNKNFTVESFSQLQGTDWNYSNTPKMFNITLGTRVLASDGILNVRDFKGYGEDSYLNRVVYVVADGTNAVLVSTAPYGISNIKGAVYTADDKELKLRNVQVYDPAAYTWSGSAEATVGLLENSIVIRNGAVISTADIRKGDSVRVIKKDTTSAGDAYIIFVE
jgi:hypothetical protein